MKLIRNVYGKGSLYLISGIIFHKTLEIGYQRGCGERGRIGIDCELNTRGDHAGFHFTLQVLSFFFEISIRDNRHWNYKTNTFFTEEEDRAESLKAAAGFRGRLIDLESEDE